MVSLLLPTVGWKRDPPSRIEKGFPPPLGVGPVVGVCNGPLPPISSKRKMSPPGKRTDFASLDLKERFVGIPLSGAREIRLRREEEIFYPFTYHLPSAPPLTVSPRSTSLTPLLLLLPPSHRSLPPFSSWISAVSPARILFLLLPGNGRRMLKVEKSPLFLNCTLRRHGSLPPPLFSFPCTA